MDVVDAVFGVILLVTILFTVIIPIWRGGVFWVPANPKVVRKMLAFAKIKSGELVLDLGSGDGRIPIVAAKEFGARAIGIEINFYLVWWARLRAKIARAIDVHFRWQDFWSTDVSKADVITLFLYDKSTIRIGEKLLREAKSDVRVVSHLWKMGKGWQLVSSDKENGVLVYEKEGRKRRVGA